MTCITTETTRLSTGGGRIAGMRELAHMCERLSATLRICAATTGVCVCSRAKGTNGCEQRHLFLRWLHAVSPRVSTAGRCLKLHQRRALAQSRRAL